MSLPKDIAVLIPAHNEQATVATVVAAVRRVFPGEIVVIDDASTDATVAVARQSGATVLPLPLRLGAWGALQTGMRYALSRRLQGALTMDADGQHSAFDLAAVWQPVAESRADVVIGAYPQRASWARRLAWQLFRRLTKLTVRDITSGFRAYNHRALAVLAAPGASLLDYQDVGVLLLLRQAGLHTAEVPVTMNPRQAGHSRVFSSWMVVARYMLHTLVLCVARGVRP
ncbi:MAG: glycosyltransferase family 2 protein [Candidatus Competibacterales bacterium]